ncbi:hypothetical protein BV22DRAFT_1044259 [Leucogyrophana mollusca]|uniref:Uncharacterized protein n=1 Tax=Leucogyrophana mollusca TaxID=85980 RepID=A0ACB8BTR7_9AGAM|nr:hypothetical protein BV22DRAFT_1044259 [Leucogyrophana mollusca]
MPYTLFNSITVLATYDESELIGLISEEFAKWSGSNIVDNTAVAVALDYGNLSLTTHATFKVAGHLGVDIVIGMNWIGLCLQAALADDNLQVLLHHFLTGVDLDEALC